MRVKKIYVILKDLTIESERCVAPQKSPCFPSLVKSEAVQPELGFSVKLLYELALEVFLLNRGFMSLFVRSWKG